MTEINNPPGLCYIQKMDYSKAKGYWVRLAQYRQPKRQKFFSYRKHGSWKAALLAAKRWRNKNYKAMPFKYRVHSNNYLTGNGVFEQWKCTDKYCYLYITATWCLFTKHHYRYFSVNKYGYTEAIKLAKAVRKKNTKHHRRSSFKRALSKPL